MSRINKQLKPWDEGPPGAESDYEPEDSAGISQPKRSDNRADYQSGRRRQLSPGSDSRYDSSYANKCKGPDRNKPIKDLKEISRKRYKSRSRSISLDSDKSVKESRYQSANRKINNARSSSSDKSKDASRSSFYRYKKKRKSSSSSSSSSSSTSSSQSSGSDSSNDSISSESSSKSHSNRSTESPKLLKDSFPLKKKSLQRSSSEEGNCSKNISDLKHIEKSTDKICTESLLKLNDFNNTNEPESNTSKNIDLIPTISTADPPIVKKNRRSSNALPPPPYTATPFKNDGSFLEIFKKMQESQSSEVSDRPVASGAVVEVKKPALPFIGKRRGGRLLKTGLVKKAKAIDEQHVDNTPKDAWSLYMQEVKKYRETSCEEEGKTRPLVK